MDGLEQAIRDALPPGYKVVARDDYKVSTNCSTVVISSSTKDRFFYWDWAWNISYVPEWVKLFKLPPIEGIKYDSDKPRMDLLPPLATLEVAKVLAFGARKYAPGNWKKVPELQERYTAAALRHMFEHMQNPDSLDTESGIDTLAHAICCLMFKLEDKLEKGREGQGS